MPFSFAFSQEFMYCMIEFVADKKCNYSMKQKFCWNFINTFKWFVSSMYPKNHNWDNPVFFISREQGLDFLPFRAWIGLWTAFLLMLIVAFDLSALVRYITRFTEESFASLIAVIFIVEAFTKLIGECCSPCMLFLWYALCCWCFAALGVGISKAV